MADNNETLILRVQLDEGKTEQRLQQLVLDLDKTRAAQRELNAARKAGTVDDAAFAQQTVALRAQLKSQTQESAALTKNLELFRTANTGVANSYQSLQAQLSLAQDQYKLLEGSADNSSEAAQALSKTIDELRNTLKATDAQQSLFIRNVGAYPKAGENVAQLVAQLVKLEEQQKQVSAGTEQAIAIEQQRIGFQTAAQQALAKENRTYEEATAIIQQHSAAIRPAVAELVKLEQAERRVAAGAEEAGDEVAKIGFKIAQAKRAIAQANDEFEATPAAAKEAGEGISDALGPPLATVQALGLDTGNLESGFQRAKRGIDMAKASFGTLRGAMLAVPIFLLIAGFSALITYFTKTREGSAALQIKLDELGAATDIFTERIGRVGKALTQLFSGDYKGAAETARLAFKGIGDEMLREVVLAGALSKARQQLERDEINNLDTNKRLLNQVERLKNVRDNEFVSLEKRNAANEEAYRIELEREKTLADLAKRKVELLLLEINRKGGLEKATNDELRTYKQAQNELADIQEDAAGKQNEFITSRYNLAQEGIDREIEARKQQLDVEAADLAGQLQKVQANSDAELNLLQRQLNNARQAELNVKDLTVKQKKAIDQRYENENYALTIDFQRRRLQAELKAMSDLSAARLANAQAGSPDVLQEQIEQVELNRRAQLAALKEGDDNTAAIEKINAQAAQQRRQLEYQDSLRLLQQYLADKQRLLDEAHDKGKVGDAEYNRQTLAIERAGLDATGNLNLAYQQDNTDNLRRYGQLEVKEGKRVKDETKKTEEAKQAIKEQTVQAALNYTDALIAAFGEETAAGQAAVALKKTLGIAEIGINLGKQLSLNATTGAEIGASIPPPAGPVLGVAYTVAADAVAITAAAAQVANILKLQQGGIAVGPSHAQGGIPLYHRGRPAGIEIEGGEPVLVRSVSASPHLLAAASAINVAAGGRPLVAGPRPYLALGGITSTLVRDAVNGADGLDYNKLAGAMNKASFVVKTQDIARALAGQQETKVVSSTKQA